MTATTITPKTDGPLTDAHQRELALAGPRAKPIRKAARVASFNGWITAIIAALSAPFAIFSVAGFLVAVGLALVAYNEFRGRKRLLAFDPSGATLLGWNQLGFLALITVYCLWAMYSYLFGGSIDAELASNPDISAIVGPIDDIKPLIQLMVLVFYPAVIILSALFQGGNAIYYFTRRKYVDAFLRETPEWVVDLKRATAPA